MRIVRALEYLVGIKPNKPMVHILGSCVQGISGRTFEDLHENVLWVQVAVYDFFPLLTAFCLVLATSAEDSESIDELIKYSPEEPFWYDVRKSLRKAIVLPFTDVVYLILLFEIRMTFCNDWSVFIITWISYTSFRDSLSFELLPCVFPCSGDGFFGFL